MSRLHICNTFFEREIEKTFSRSLEGWMRSHPVVLQLQFLPILYAAPADTILVTDLAEKRDSRLCLYDQVPQNLPIEHWGPSLAIHHFAKNHNIEYTIPEWEIVRKINSKVFSFTESPKLPGAKLLESQEEIEEWMKVTPDPKIMKTPFGSAGSGHIKATNVKRLYMTPLIGEPWVERILDFSTQWEEGKLIGVTIFENEPNGTYKGTYVGDVPIWALDEHLKIAEPLIKKIGQMGYSGNIGIDAFIYLWKGEKRVHPVVEINARKTMSWVALKRPEKRLTFTHAHQGLLPSYLRDTTFSRNIAF